MPVTHADRAVGWRSLTMQAVSELDNSRAIIASADEIVDGPLRPSRQGP